MFEPALKSVNLEFRHELTKDQLAALPQQLSILNFVSFLILWMSQKKNQIFIILDVVPVKMQRVSGAHRRNFRQGIQCKIASVATSINLINSGFEPSLSRQKARTSTTRPSGQLALTN